MTFAPHFANNAADTHPQMRSKPQSRQWIVRRVTSVNSWLALIAAPLATLAQTTPQTPGEAWTAPGRAARKQNPVPADAKSIAAGKELFTVGCLPCHGPAGKGDGPAAATLEREGHPIRPGNLSNTNLWQQPDGALFWKVSEGKSPMPAFQETFSEEQRWHIVNYVRTLAPREANKSSDPKR